MAAIRKGDIPDMGAICELASEMHEQSIYSDIKPDETKFRLFVAGIMGSKGGIVLLIVDKDDKPQGFLLGVLEELFFSRQRMATDLAIYARGSYRHLVPRLIKTFVTWAESKPRVVRVTLGISSGIGDPERTSKMYGTLGFEQIGSINVKKVVRTS